VYILDPALARLREYTQNFSDFTKYFG